MDINDIKENMNKDKNLSPYACLNNDAYRLVNENDNDIRPPFLRDSDRIIYSLSYTRYIDKTQVFSENENDHITKRMTHVQMVSKIARTIGRALNLNEDLIEAAALGHDIGHVPFGHFGERILNNICLENNLGYFNHNVQSVREFMNLEKNGKGLNLNVQVLDAILCHNGEIELAKYEPKNKTKEDFLKDYESCYIDENANKNLRPMTLEGCVVRVSDIIAYLGRDIEDAIRLGLLKIDEVPKSITKILGNTNKDLITTFVLDIIENSYQKNYIAMSKELFEVLQELKSFNYINIYNKAISEDKKVLYEDMFRSVYKYYLDNIDDDSSLINEIYLKDMNQDYLNSTSKERKVVDFIAGMTDDFLIKTYEKIKDKKKVLM